jgi:DNA polymerase-1
MIKAPEGYMLLALDFTGQELRIAADDSRDPNFLDCYMGENKRDVHSLTGVSIAQKSGLDIEYSLFAAQVDENPEYKEYRTLGKRVNFTCQFGALAPKVSHTLCISESEAQKYITSRAEAFPVLIKRVIEHNKVCKKRGHAKTMLGARRHLGGHQHYGSKNSYDHQSADRLAYSMRIQGSAAEMVKLVMGEIHRQGILDGDKVLGLMQIHDELVFAIREDSMNMILVLMEIMCQPYADMIIPLETEPKVGTHFGNLKTYEVN